MFIRKNKPNDKLIGSPLIPGSFLYYANSPTSTVLMGIVRVQLLVKIKLTLAFCWCNFT
jgi:hypothetical protein